MTESTKDSVGQGPESAEPEVKPAAKAESSTDKVGRLTDEALAAGKRITQSDAGRKAAAFADTVFDKAEELGRKVSESDTGRKVADKAHELHDKALDTELGRKVADKAHDLGDSEAGQTAKKVWQTPLGKNVGTGAAAGAALGLVVPIVGPLFGAVLGGGLGYLRTLARKPGND